MTCGYDQDSALSVAHVYLDSGATAVVDGKSSIPGRRGVSAAGGVNYLPTYQPSSTYAGT
ncbi:hypothetical protein LZ30DRAFT_721654 [Colletotrichum cereale]|nr:hypothetical protein LZ30DRAFT_721654 [Colletotrichum cereale]